MRLRWVSNITMYNPGSERSREYDVEGEQPYPPIDVITTDDEIHIWADLPGVRTEDINIYIQNDLLVIEGVKQSYYPQGQRRVFHRVERQSAPFRRVLRLLSPVNENSVFSKLDNGVLHIFWKRH